MDKGMKLLAIIGSLMVFAFVMVAVAVCSIDSEGPGPVDAFTAHLQALDESRLDDANALVDITCGQIRRTDLEAAQNDLESAGLTFQTAFRISEVWTNERGTRAIIELDTPPQLPLPGVQGMALVEGQWMLYCGRD